MEPEAQLATVSTSCCDPSSSASSRVDPTLDLLTSFLPGGVLWTQFLLQGLGFVPSYSSDHTGGLPQSSGCRAWVVASSTGTFRGPL